MRTRNSTADSFDLRVNNLFDGLENHVNRMNGLFDGFEHRLNRMNVLFDGLENHVNRMNGLFDGFGHRLNRMNVLFDGFENRLNRIDGVLENHGALEGQHQPALQSGNNNENPLPIIFKVFDEGEICTIVEMCISISYLAITRPHGDLLCYIVGGAILTKLNKSFTLDSISLGIDELQEKLLKRKSHRLKEKLQQTLLRLIWFILILTVIDAKTMEEFVKKMFG